MEDLCWGTDYKYPPRTSPFDFVIGSDITYFSAVHNELLKSISSLIPQGAATRVLIAADFESKRTKIFLKKAEEAGFEHTHHAPVRYSDIATFTKDFGPCKANLEQWEDDDDDAMAVYELRRK